MTKSNDMKDRKFLIFDGISGVAMGKDIHETLTALGVGATYVDGQQLARKTMYKIRGAVAKSYNKIRRKDGFYHFPKARSRSILDVIKAEQPDCILVIGFLYRFISPADVKALKDKLNFKLYLYDTDSCNFYGRRREFIFFLENELTAYDHIFSFSKVTTDFFRKVRGLNADYLPFGACPIPIQNHQEELDVLFVGSGDLRRIFMLEKINDHLTVYGKRWRRNEAFMSPQLKSKIHHMPVWGDELHRLLQRSKIVLNITRSDFYGAETGINLRIFEALSAGCFLLTDYSDELNALFKVGTEIETYHSSDELHAKVHYYLSNDEERRAIAHKGLERFQRDFSWEAIMKKMLRLIEAL